MIVGWPEHADDLAIGHVQARKQGSGPMALVIAGHGSTTPLLPRQTRLCAVQRLDLTLLIRRDHHCVRGRIQIQVHHIFQLLSETRVVTELEALHPVRFQSVRPPDSTDRRRTHGGHRCQGAGAPVSRSGGLLLGGKADDLVNGAR
jgi:hypothetical protein